MRQDLGADGQGTLVDVEVGRMEEVPAAVVPGDPEPQEAAGGVRRGRPAKSSPPMLGSGIETTWSAPTTSAAARAQTAVTIGSLTTASTRGSSVTSTVVPLASARPRPIWRSRSSTCAAAGQLRVRTVPLSSTVSGMTFGLAPPWITPNVTTAGLAGVDRARDELVDADDELDGHGDRVGRLVRPRGVAAHAPDRHLQVLAEGRHHAGPLRDLADGQVGVDVKRDDRADPLDRARRDHLVGPLAGLLGRLEDRPARGPARAGARGTARAPAPRPSPSSRGRRGRRRASRRRWSIGTRRP